MDKLAKIKYLKEIVEELEEELEKERAIELNTAKDVASINPRDTIDDGTVNFVDDIPIYECKRDDKRCLAIKAIIGCSIVAICIIIFSYA